MARYGGGGAWGQISDEQGREVWQNAQGRIWTGPIPGVIDASAPQHDFTKDVPMSPSSPYQLSGNNRTSDNVWANMFRDTQNSTYVSSFSQPNRVTTTSPVTATIDALNKTLDSILDNPFDNRSAIGFGGNGSAAAPGFGQTVDANRRPISSVPNHADEWQRPQRRANPILAPILSRQGRDQSGNYFSLSTIAARGRERVQQYEEPTSTGGFSWGSAFY